VIRGWSRWLLAILGVILAGFVAQRLFGGKTVTGRLVSSKPVAMLGSGSRAVAVADDGTILAWLPPPEENSLPQLPLASPPEGERLAGTLLQQVRVLAVAPPALRPYLARSYYGENGVDVELSSGIELRFGDASAAARKWRAAAAVLADPEVTALDYVDLHVPRHPATGGSGHTLPPIP
jgi:cell division septal protein FtsQ